MFCHEVRGIISRSFFTLPEKEDLRNFDRFVRFIFFLRLNGKAIWTCSCWVSRAFSKRIPCEIFLFRRVCCMYVFVCTKKFVILVLQNTYSIVSILCKFRKKMEMKMWTILFVLWIGEFKNVYKWKKFLRETYYINI